MKFIKLLNEQVAAMLVARGFSYITQEIKDYTLYCFEYSKELLDTLDIVLAENNSVTEHSDYIIDDTLCL